MYTGSALALDYFLKDKLVVAHLYSNLVAKNDANLLIGHRCSYFGMCATFMSAVGRSCTGA